MLGFFLGLDDFVKIIAFGISAGVSLMVAFGAMVTPLIVSEIMSGVSNAFARLLR